MLISELCEETRVIGIYGLAKNTGKTVVLNTIIEEFFRLRYSVGITSIGRDGENKDVINEAIAKPPIVVGPGNLVATARCLLRQSGLSYKILENPSIRTPLGDVVLARIESKGSLVVAGPGTGDGVRFMTKRMLENGAAKVMVDGAINRKTAACPSITDGVVVATGAVLDNNLEKVLRETEEIVSRVCMPELEYPSIRGEGVSCEIGFALTAEGHYVYIEDSFALIPRLDSLRDIDRAFGRVQHIVTRGAICQGFLDSATEYARGGEVFITAVDSARFHFGDHSIKQLRRRGVHLRVLTKTNLLAVTVNPVSPLHHQFDSKLICKQLEERLPGVPIRDVMGADYLRNKLLSYQLEDGAEA